MSVTTDQWVYLLQNILFLVGQGYSALKELCVICITISLLPSLIHNGGRYRIDN